MIKNAALGLTMVLFIALTACSTMSVPPRPSVSQDESVAKLLYRTNLEFEAERLKGSSLGMAYATRDRHELIQTLVHAEQTRTPAFRSIVATTRKMVDQARSAANEDEQILAAIEQLVPNLGPFQSGSEDSFGMNGLFGKARKVDLTIGLEMDADLRPGLSDEVVIPVDASKPTTIYVQPTEAFVGEPLNLTMQVHEVGSAAMLESPVCDIERAHTQLACLVPPGAFTHVRIRLENKGTVSVSVIVFVSGNAGSVSAALASP